MIVTFYGRYSPRPGDSSEIVSNESQWGMAEKWLIEKMLPAPPPELRFFDEHKSRDDMNRPALWDCAKATRSGVMVAYALDRVGDVLAIETVVRILERQRGQLATVVEGLQKNDPDSELMRVFRGGLARHQKRKTAETTSRHIRERQAKGERMSRFPPVGKQFKQIGVKHKSVNGKLVEVPHCIIVDADEEELDVIQQVRDVAARYPGKPYKVLGMVRKYGVKLRGGLIGRKAVMRILGQVD